MVSRLMVACAVAGGVFAAANAATPAVEGLAWKWERGQVRRYVAAADLVLVEAIPVYAIQNIDGLAANIGLTMVIACTPTADLGKKGWEIRCDIEDATMSVVPNPVSVGRMQPVVEEWSRILRDDASIQLEQGTNGRIRSVDLEGTLKDNARLQEITEWMSQIVQRTLAPLDVELPKDGTDAGVGYWMQRGSQVFAFPSLTGSLGSGQIVWTVGAQNEGRVLIRAAGKGSIASSETLLDQPRNFVTFTLDGAAVFDRSAGHLRQSNYLFDGAASSGSVQGEARTSTYVQQATLRLLEANEVVKLQPPAELPIK